MEIVVYTSMEIGVYTRYIVISWKVQQIIHATFKKTRIINKNIDLVTKLIYS